jgi:hypothetical protein
VSLISTTVINGSVFTEATNMIDLHDAVTKCSEPLKEKYGKWNIFQLFERTGEKQNLRMYCPLNFTLVYNRQLLAVFRYKRIV